MMRRRFVPGSAALAICALLLGGATAQDGAPTDPVFAEVLPSPFEDLQRRKWGHPVIADLDQDGFRDLLIIDHGWAVKVYWNDAGIFGEPYDVIVGDIHGIAIADYDADGFLEAAISRGGGSGSNPRNTKFFRFGRDRAITELGELDPPLRGMRGRTHKWFDGDQDGDLDLLQFGFPARPPREEGEHDLLRNDGGGRLELDSLLPRGGNDDELTLLTDVDGDGDPDIVRYGQRPLRLFRGGEGLSFNEVAADAIPGEYWHVTSVVEFDYDNDGDMDLYLARGRMPGNFETFYDEETQRLGFYAKRGTHELPPLAIGHMLEISSYQAQYPDHRIWVGESAYEWQRMRDGRDWHAVANITIPSADALGFPDTRTERGLHFGYIGNGEWRFILDTFPPVSGVIEGVPNFEESEHVEELPDVLLRNDGGRFTDVTRESGLFRRSHSMGVAVGDWNNDGLADLFITNRGTPILGQSHSIWMNRGNGSFQELTESPVATDEIGSFGWSAEALDFDNDGWLDLVFSNERGLWHLRRNESEVGSRNSSLTVVVGSAPESGASAMGALVTVSGCERSQIRRVGSSGAPYSHSFDTHLHFGTGMCEAGHTIHVRWADGSEFSENSVFDQVFVVGN